LRARNDIKQFYYRLLGAFRTCSSQIRRQAHAFLDALRHQRDEKSRRDCASFLEEKRDDRENRVEDERRAREHAIGGGRLAHKSVTGLNQGQHRNENDDADLSRDGAVVFQIEDRAEKKNSDLQYKFDASMIPKTEANFHRVVIDGEIRTMNNQIEKPMGKNSETHK
jgi:hypothetical protein